MAYGKPRGGGCFKKGCLWLMALLVFAALAVAGLGFYVRQTYTQASKAALPAFETDPQHVEEVAKRFDVFKKAAEAGRPSRLELSGDDLNALAGSAPETAGKVFFTIQGDEMTVLGGLPMEGIPFFQGRYLNGTATLNFEATASDLKLDIRAIEINDESVPNAFVKEFEKSARENYARQRRESREKNNFLANLDHAAIMDGKLVVTTGEGPPLAKESPPPAKAPQKTEPVVQPPDPPRASMPEREPERIHICTQKVVAYSPSAPTQKMGMFLPGSRLLVFGPAETPGMVQVEFQTPDGRTIRALCRADDLMEHPVGQLQEEPKPTGIAPLEPVKGLGGSKAPNQNPSFKGIGK